jgi:hypothetical protein
VRTLGRDEDKVEVLGRLRRLRPETERRFGRMSAHQMVCHLADALRMGLGQKAVRDASGPLGRTLVKWVALYAPLPWPAGIPTSPEIDQAGGGTRPGEFVADLAHVEALVELMAAPARALAPSHPVFGAMSRAAWLRWGYRHLDHHLRQFGT